MKKMLVTLSIVGFLFGGNAYAGSCESPKFLKEGKTYTFSVAVFKSRDVDLKVLKIDACWLKVLYGKKAEMWLNLATISTIVEK